jgi:cytochrome c556
MNGWRRVVAVAFVFALAVGATISAEEERAAHGSAAKMVPSHGLPAALGVLFPPQASEPEFLMHMFGLGGGMTGVVVDFATQDTEHLASSFEAFAATYRETAGLVPEWGDRFPMGPIDALGEALASGDPGRVGPAIEAVAEVCESCHHENMVAVTQRFEWPDANAITITDPVSNGKLSHAEFMRMLDFSLTGITHDLAQGQVDAARGHFADFKHRFAALGDMCEECHGTEERFYYTDAASAARVEAIGEALAADAPDPAAVGGAVMEVGLMTCHRCHLVHVPAAFAKASAAH